MWLKSDHKEAINEILLGLQLPVNGFQDILLTLTLQKDVIWK